MGGRQSEKQAEQGGPHPYRRPLCVLESRRRQELPQMKDNLSLTGRGDMGGHRGLTDYGYGWAAFHPENCRGPNTLAGRSLKILIAADTQKESN